MALKEKKSLLKKTQKAKTDPNKMKVFGFCLFGKRFIHSFIYVHIYDAPDDDFGDYMTYSAAKKCVRDSCVWR